MRILVTGSRDWDDWSLLANTLIEAAIVYAERNGVTPVTLVHGNCPMGADRFADKVGKWLSWNVERHPADWERHGKRAGFVRNAEMVALGADLCLAFIRNGSRGASMTADLAEQAGIETRRFVT